MSMMRINRISTVLQIVLEQIRSVLETNMKQKTHSKLVAIVRTAMHVPAVSFAGLLLLTSSVAAQNNAPVYTPGSTSTFKTVTNEVDSWVPPVTVAPASSKVEAKSSTPEWSPPRTHVEASIPEVILESSPSAVTIQSSDIVNDQPVQATATAVQDLELLDGDALQFDSSNSSEVIPSIPVLGNDDHMGQSVITGDPGFPEASEFPQSFETQVFEGDQFQADVVEGDSGATVVNPFGPIGPPLKTPVRNLLRGTHSWLGGDGVNAVGQLTFLSLSRDYRGNGRTLSNGAPNLSANGPDEGTFTGVDISYGQRRAGGQGWEMRYFGFNPGQETDVAGSSPTLVWGGLTPPLNDPATFGGSIPFGIPETFGLSGIGFGNISVADLFDDAANHRVSRDSELGSFEFNLLRASAGGRCFTCGNAMVELFGGLRGVSFRETTNFSARALQSAGAPQSAFYESEVQNSLFGVQIGGRLERQRQNGWSTSFGTRVGIYNNRVESRQRAQVQLNDGSTAVPQVLFGPDAGRNFDFEGTDNELAFLGEIDLGVIYQFRPRTRLRFGYRGIAITNIADSAGQLEDSLFDVGRVTEPRVLGDLIVGGFYYGIDHAF